MFLGIAALLISACAHDPEVVAARDSWKGAPYDDVVKAWGPPDKSATKDGRETRTWVSREVPPAGFHGGVTVSGGTGGAGGALFGPPTESNAVCERILVFNGGRVSDQTWNGPPDFCKRFNKK